LESENSRYPEILGIRKLSKQGILKLESIAERDSNRVEVLVGSKFTGKMANKMKFTTKMVNKIKFIDKNVK
jgi:hypothetical protein